MKCVAFCATALVALLFASPALAGGRLTIPKLGIWNMPIYQPQQMDSGPFWDSADSEKYAYRPDDVGKPVVIGGHDVTPVRGYGAHGPFYNLVNLDVGDLIMVRWKGALHKYRVVRPHNLMAYAASPVVDDGRSTLWLYCCWPRYTAKGHQWVEAVEVSPRSS
jgi:sortase (surface protein transpeptidase)